MALVRLKGPEAALDPADDETVVQEVLGGDAGRFEILMRRHNPRLFRTARAILRDDGEAEDAVQQSYLAAFAKLDQFRGDARFSTWMTRITVHEALRRMRKDKRLTDLSLIENESDDSAPDPEEQAAGGELRDLLEGAVDALPESYRVVFVLREVEELSTRETAQCLDLTEEAVRVRLHRARAALRDWLYERADTLANEAFRFAGDQCNRIVAYVLARIVE